MQKAKHRPGPWRYIDDSTPGTLELGLHDYCVETSDGNISVADLISFEADARLIAAAPDLLEALEAMITAYGAVGIKENPNSAIYKARSAVAKAKAA